MPFSSGAEPGLIRQVLSVLFVFALLGGVLWKLSQGRKLWRMTPWTKSSSSGRVLQAVERIVLTPQHMLHLVDIGGKQIVVATYPNGCSALAGYEERAASAVGNRAQAGSLPHVI